MRVLMDADCLVKLTKAELKELVCEHIRVEIPDAVRREVVDAGKAGGHPDADVVARNLAEGRLRVAAGADSEGDGDGALLAGFAGAGYDAVASDDGRLIRRLRLHSVPCLLPGTLLLHLQRMGALDTAAASRALDRLAPYISDEEHSTVRLVLDSTATDTAGEMEGEA